MIGETHLRIYLDLCCLNRPFDDQTQPRIYLETQALLLLMDRIAAGKHRFCASVALEVENEQNPHKERRSKIGELIKQATDWIPYSRRIDARVDELLSFGLRHFDAYHAASAEAGACDRLVTCDDRFLRTSRRSAAKIRVVVTDLLTLSSEPGF